MLTEFVKRSVDYPRQSDSLLALAVVVLRANDLVTTDLDALKSYLSTWSQLILNYRYYTVGFLDPVV